MTKDQSASAEIHEHFEKLVDNYVRRIPSGRVGM